MVELVVEHLDCHVEFGPPVKNVPRVQIFRNTWTAIEIFVPPSFHTLSLRRICALVQAVLLEKLSLHVQSKG